MTIKKIPISEIAGPIPRWVREDTKKKTAYLLVCGVCGTEFVSFKVEPLKNKKSSLYGCSRKCGALITAAVRPPPKNPKRAKYSSDWIERQKLKNGSR